MTDNLSGKSISENVPNLIQDFIKIKLEKWSKSGQLMIEKRLVSYFSRLLTVILSNIIFRTL